MYLFPADLYYRGDKRRRPSPREPKKHGRLIQKRNQYEEWVKMRLMIREDDIRRATRTKPTSGFLRRVMPDTAKREQPSSPEPELSKKQFIVCKVEAKTPRRGPPLPITSTSKKIVYETPKQGFFR